MRLLPSTSHLPAQLDENSVAVRIGLWSRDPKRDGGRLESERTTIGPGLDRKQKQQGSKPFGAVRPVESHFWSVALTFAAGTEKTCAIYPYMI
jgi:hypothetical protein